MKAKLRWLVVPVATTALLGACGGGSDSSDGGGDGKTLYQQSCSSCHGPKAEGISGMGKDLTKSEFTQGLTDAEFVEFVKTGRPVDDPANTTGIPMPPKGGRSSLSDEDIAAIVAYLRTLEA